MKCETCGSATYVAELFTATYDRCPHCDDGKELKNEVPDRYNLSGWYRNALRAILPPSRIQELADKQAAIDILNKQLAVPRIFVPRTQWQGEYLGSWTEEEEEYTPTYQDVMEENE